MKDVNTNKSKLKEATCMFINSYAIRAPSMDIDRTALIFSLNEIFVKEIFGNFENWHISYKMQLSKTKLSEIGSG